MSAPFKGELTTSGIPFAAYRDAAEKVLGTCHWITFDEGIPPECSEEGLHATPTTGTDRRIHLNDGFMRFLCFHTSCARSQKVVNNELSRLGRDIWKKHGCPERKGGSPFCSRTKSTASIKKLPQAAKLKLEADIKSLITTYSWPLSAVKAASKPIPAIADQPYTAMGLFKPGDVVWSGERYDSGHWWAKKNFRTREQWLSSPSLRGPLICPSVFKSGYYARKSCNIVQRRFLILESDTLPHDHACGVYNWFVLGVGLNLRCIVDSGGKSLHAWFDYPGDDLIGELKGILPVMGFDPSMLRATQCTRLPGVMRKDTRLYQKLIYLA